MNPWLTGLVVPPKVIHAQGDPKLFFFLGGGGGWRAIVGMFYGLEMACLKMLVPGGVIFLQQDCPFPLEKYIRSKIALPRSDTLAWHPSAYK